MRNHMERQKSRPPEQVIKVQCTASLLEWSLGEDGNLVIVRDIGDQINASGPVGLNTACQIKPIPAAKRVVKYKLTIGKRLAARQSRKLTSTDVVHSSRATQEFFYRNFFRENLLNCKSDPFTSTETIVPSSPNSNFHYSTISITSAYIYITA